MDKSQRRAVKDRVQKALRGRHGVNRLKGIDEVLSQLMEVGRVAAIGGLVRETGVYGRSSPRCDFDFAVEVKEPVKLAKLLQSHAWNRNRFGGFKLRIESIDLEFWDIQQTWAHRAGHVTVNCLEDIANTTFFNIDAVLCPLQKGESIIASEAAISGLNERLLDINLLPNPNPLGAAVRALRRMFDHDMRASDQLAAYIGSQIDAEGWAALADLDRRAFPWSPVLQEIGEEPFETGASFQRWLSRHGNHLPTPRQDELDLKVCRPPTSQLTTNHKYSQQTCRPLVL